MSSLYLSEGLQPSGCTHSISPRPLIMETVKRVTLNLTFLSFASIPDSRCLRSLEMNLDEGVSTSSSPSAFPAASKGHQRSITMP